MLLFSEGPSANSQGKAHLYLRIRKNIPSVSRYRAPPGKAGAITAATQGHQSTLQRDGRL